MIRSFPNGLWLVCPEQGGTVGGYRDWNWAYGIRCPVYFLGGGFLLRQRTIGNGQCKTD